MAQIGGLLNPNVLLPQANPGGGGRISVPAGFGLSISIIGLQQLETMLMEGYYLARDSKKELELSVDAWYKEAELRFQTGQRYWPALSARRVAERGKSGPILIDTGDLHEAATGNQSGFSGQDIMGWKRIGPRNATIGLRGDKVQHNEGFVNAQGFTVPKREFWGWDDSNGGEVDMLFEPFEKAWDNWLGGGSGPAGQLSLWP